MDWWDTLHNRVCQILESGPPESPPSPNDIKKALLLIAEEIDAIKPQIKTKGTLT